MKTIKEVLQLAALYLQERKVEPARRSAEELLAHILRMKRIDLYVQFDRPVEEKELAVLREWVKRVAKGEPLEYLTGAVEFLGCAIKVDRNVLIPRPETEILADLIKKRVRGNSLWDVCTGSGCIGISLKKALPHLSVVLSDISPEALAVAKDNAARNNVEVEFLLGDLMTPFAGRMADAIVCNPPYLSGKEYLEIDGSVRDYEPKVALVGGERGTELYERLSTELPPFLTPGGQVFLEIGASQGPAMKKIFEAGPWEKIELIQDWSGKDRFFFLEKQVLSRVSY